MGVKGWTIFSIITLLVIGGLIYYSSGEKLDVSGYDTTSIIGANEDNGGIGDHVRGNKDAPVIIVEYGDYQCPACSGISISLDNMVKKYDETALVFRNFPLTSIHPNSKTASAVAEASGLQGHYWEVHDKIYSQQKSWSDASVSERIDVLTGYATPFDVDKDKLTEDISSDKVAKKLAFDKAIAEKDNVSGTPTVFINGKELDNDTVTEASNGNVKGLEDAIRAALKEAGVDLKKYDNEK